MVVDDPERLSGLEAVPDLEDPVVPLEGGQRTEVELDDVRRLQDVLRREAAVADILSHSLLIRAHSSWVSAWSAIW
jgi:hypothetical protein